MTVAAANRHPRVAHASSPADDVLRVVAAPARSLDARSPLTGLVGHDFGRIRIHSDDAAARAADALGARAYAIGRHLVFGRGRYEPGTTRGDALLTHELAHAVQQGLADPHTADLEDARVDPSPGAEREARSAAAAVAHGRFAPPIGGRTGLAYARDDPTTPVFPWSPVVPQGRRMLLEDADAGQTRPIYESSDEFKKNYVDYNMASADYWDTPYAASAPEYRSFWVDYTDGRRLQFGLDDIRARTRIVPPPGSGARIVRLKGFPAFTYYKRGGFIFPDHYDDVTTPRLVDVVTTIAYNHRQREQFLEIANVTFAFAMILTAYVPGAETPDLESAAPSPTRLPERGGASPDVEVPAAEQREAPRRTQSRSKSVPEKGTAGDRAASAGELAAREPLPPAALPASQQAIADSLRAEHPGLVPAVAADAARGGARAAGAGGAGADVILLHGGAREVSVHRGIFTLENIGRHLLEEQAQAGTTEIYMQMNTGTREELLNLIPDLRRGYHELEGVFVKFFGPDGRVWWNGRFWAP